MLATWTVGDRRPSRFYFKQVDQAVLLLLTLLIKARVQIVTGSAIGIFLLLLQTLAFLAISGGLVPAAGGAALVAKQQRRSASA